MRNALALAITLALLVSGCQTGSDPISASGAASEGEALRQVTANGLDHYLDVLDVHVSDLGQSVRSMRRELDGSFVEGNPTWALAMLGYAARRPLSYGEVAELMDELWPQDGPMSYADVSALLVGLGPDVGERDLSSGTAADVLDRLGLPEASDQIEERAAALTTDELQDLLLAGPTGGGVPIAEVLDSLLLIHESDETCCAPNALASVVENAEVVEGLSDVVDEWGIRLAGSAEEFERRLVAAQSQVWDFGPAVAVAAGRVEDLREVLRPVVDGDQCCGDVSGGVDEALAKLGWALGTLVEAVEPLKEGMTREAALDQVAILDAAVADLEAAIFQLRAVQTQLDD